MDDQLPYFFAYSDSGVRKRQPCDIATAVMTGPAPQVMRTETAADRAAKAALRSGDFSRFF